MINPLSLQDIRQGVGEKGRFPKRVDFRKIRLKVGVGEGVYFQSCKDSEFTETFDAIPYYLRIQNHRSVFFRLTSYVDQMSAWYDVKTKLEVINIKVFEKLEVWYTIIFLLEYISLHQDIVIYRFCSKLIGPSNSSLIATFGSIH